MTDDLCIRIAAAIDRKYTEEAIGHTYEVCLHAADAVIRELQADYILVPKSRTLARNTFRYGERYGI